MEELINGIQQLSSKINSQNNHVTSPSIKSFIRILLEKKLIQLTPDINQFTKIIKSENISDEDLTIVCRKLNNLITLHSTEMCTIRRD